MHSDYHGLKKHVSMVKKQQEHEDRRYQSSLYPATSVGSHVLQLPTTGKPHFLSFLQRSSTNEGAFDPTGRNRKANLFRYSPRYSLDSPHQMERPHVDIKDTTVVEKFQPSRPILTYQPRGRSAILTFSIRLPACLHNQKQYVFRCTSYL